MLKLNHLVIGVLLGSVAPLVSILLSESRLVETLSRSKPLAIYLFAGVINLLLTRYLYRNGKERIGMGVVMATFFTLLLLLYGKGLRI